MQDEIKKSISDLYELAVTKASVFRDGSDNTVWILETKDGKKYVARVSKRDMGDGIAFEAEWLQFLKSKGLPVVPIVENKSGKPYAFLPDKHAITVFEFVAGKHLPFDKETPPPLQAVASAAKALAQLHNASRTANVRPKRIRTVYTELERVLADEKEIVKRIPDGTDLVSAAKRFISLKDLSKPVLVHNDYRISNLMFDENLNAAAILDFDWSCMGPAIKDVAHALAEWSFPDGASSHWQNIYETFLKNYNEESDVKIADDKHLREWIAFGCLSDACTYIVDRLERGEIKSANGSYMYKKFLYFQKS